MHVVRYIVLVRKLFTAILFQLLRRLFNGIRGIHWQLNGTAEQLRQVTDPRYYERSAHVVDVVAFYKLSIFLRLEMTDFIYVHNRFDSPQYVIDNDHVTLMTIDDKNAIFVEARDKSMQLWQSKFSSFMKLAQTKYMRRLIIVPLPVFHIMSEVIGDPSGQLILLFNTGRCGSTLLAKIMESTERCVTVSEPDAIDQLSTQIVKCGDTSSMRQLSRDVMRWICRPLSRSLFPQQLPPLGYLVKVASRSTVMLKLYSELFPNSRSLFLYRDILTTSQSYYRASFNDPAVVLFTIVSRWNRPLMSRFLAAIGFTETDIDPDIQLNHDDLTYGVLVCTGSMKTYLDARRHGVPVSAVRYEDMVASPMESCRQIIEYCRLPVDLVSLAVRGFDTDSQQNTPMSQHTLKNLKAPEINMKAIDLLNERILRKFGLPLIGADCILQGTI